MRGGVGSESQARIHRPPLLVVLGPTASGKSGLGIALAERFGGEIVSADSRQVYCGLDIGTAKVTLEQRLLVPHHLLDVAEPGEEFSLARYQELAYAAIQGIVARGQLPLLVGGTGLYISAVVDNYHLPRVPPDSRLRRKLESLSAGELAERLRRLDPGAAERVDLANPRRVIRAIEVARAGAGGQARRGEPMFRPLLLGLDLPRQELYRRIDVRVDARLEDGMLAEAERLLAEGISHARLEALGLEYRYLSRYIRGELPSLESMSTQLKYAIHAYARRQLIWFRRDPRIHWLDATGEPMVEAVPVVEEWLERVGG